MSHKKLSTKRCPKKRSWGGPGTPQGAPRSAQEAKWEPKGHQKAPKMIPKIDENVKIELPSRRQLNFQGSGTLKIELFLLFLGYRISVPKGTRPRWLKIGFPGSLGAPRESPRAKMAPTRVPQGGPRGAQEAPKSSQNRGLFPNAPR